MTGHNDSEELRRLLEALRTKQIDLRRFCSSVRRLFGIQVLFDTLVGLREGNSRPDPPDEVEEDSSEETATAATRRKQTILVHALFCGCATCPVEGCRTIKQLVTPLKAHALRCAAGDDCEECGKWRQLQRLKEKYRRKLSGITKAPLIRRGAGGRSPRGLPGVSRHQLDSVNVAQRILSKSESSYI